MARLLPSFSPLLRKSFVLAGRIAVLVTLLIYAFSRVEVRELQRGLLQAQWSLVLAGTAFVALRVPVAAWRWQLILGGLGAAMRLELAARFTVIGLFLSRP
jgi:hypothetical protein